MVASVRSQKRSSWSYKKNKSAYGSRTSSRQCRGLKISVDRAREDIISTLFNWINWFLEV
ncbi:hypothetical protein HanRHA438_Chr17g0838621 [Helianthus annuus]|uniref:Uncharacterized protein n=1 Tax=Helianthus annuus TaxID=4232 RepID=A0A251UQG9_HELAN|nr:hypothetical protein HanRHA438_Chr17g0838621 [Helianthus annuus]